MNEWESEHGALNGKSDLICAGVPQSNETKSPPLQDKDQWTKILRNKVTPRR